MRIRTMYFAFFLLVLAALGPDGHASGISQGEDGNATRLDPVLVLDGSNVHNTGQLLMHVGNWGEFGSRPGSGESYSHAPSAEWPAGSGVEYLWSAGLWVGGVKNGIPAVSTASYQTEFRPTQDPVDIIYRAAEGDAGGARDVDDDGDGQIDEDWLDGHDNDLDGLVDEDFAAISDQMFSCWYTDNQPGITQIYPQHNPLNLHVRQESYQWNDPRFDDFVGVEFTITNIGVDVLQQVYIGYFADCDAGIGSRFLNAAITGLAAEDDASGYWAVPPAPYPLPDTLLCTDFGPVSFDIAYMYDADGDQGFAPGYFGVMLLGHTTDPTGQTAPSAVGVSTYANFAGGLSWESGGDPTNDFERYELLSQQTIERDVFVNRDYRMLISVGPFNDLAPGQSLVFQVGLVMGAGAGGLIENAAHAKALFDGVWVDRDAGPLTGIAGRETPVVGPANDVVVDSCACPTCPPVVTVLPGTVLYVNSDCSEEELLMNTCGLTDADSLLFRTGVGGRETQVHWVIDEPAPPVAIEGLSARRAGGGIELRWSVVSGGTLEGFRVYRRTGSGPSFELLDTNGLIPPQITTFLDADVRAGTGYGYAVTAVLPNGTEVRSDNVEVGTRAAVDPDSPELLQNYPNPFNPTTKIVFRLGEPTRINISIYALDGKRVRNLIDGPMPGGRSDVQWDGRNDKGNAVASGIYVYKLETPSQTFAKKMLYLK